ncbi:alkaline phosphatase family protein [Nocardia beijingensis]|uniref:alkaline phosphatase family protein n=1 Tax=Nocardia beijingensis TaxID=95162 RepID=UPI00344E6E02
MSRAQLLAKVVAVTAAAALPLSAAAGVAHGQAPAAKVVVIGLDGLMYGKIEQAQAPNLLRLSGAGLLSRSSIAPHITISGPSWATVLTGVWDRKHGITNNEFTAEPFARYPTVFTRLERARPTAKTQSIATWDRIATMTGSGSPRADVVVSTAPVPDESRTDAATADAVVAAIGRFAPDLLFTHLDQVDHAGHDAGAASRAYLDVAPAADLDGRSLRSEPGSVRTPIAGSQPAAIR